MEAKFKIGDLIMLNDHGLMILENKLLKVGLIVGGPFSMFHTQEDMPLLSYWAYDIMIGKRLITIIPEEFIDLNTSIGQTGSISAV